MALDDILGFSPAVAALRAQIQRLAAFDTVGNPHVPTVLLLGETGTGKGLIARTMHGAGPRAGGPFIDVNCAAIPESMLEAELFGFEAGAFTDAKRSKPGLFEVASGGTLFLDEVDSLSGPVQSKVLKAIEEKEIRRLGGVDSRPVDVKLITATQADLRAMVDAGRFRGDLYHRLAVLVLTLPPLRDRAGDVLLLADHYLHAYANAHHLPPKELSADARAWLGRYRFAGNVRELSHLMERVTLLCADEQITADTLAAFSDPTASAVAAPASAPTSSSKPTPSAASASDQQSAEVIRDALMRCNGNVVRAARLLGVGRNALRYRMRRLGIDREDADAAVLPAPAEQTSGAQTESASASQDREAETRPKSPSWEQKPVAVLAISFSFPREDPGAQLATYEDWTETARWQRALTDRVEGFGGTLIDRSSTRLTAVFGIPRALEQSPQRAVQAALALHRSVAAAPRPHPEIRTAVHVGEVRVDINSSPLEPQVLPIGDSLALAERLLGHAGAAEVLISAAGARRVERSCALEPRVLQMGSRESDRVAAFTVSTLLPPPTLADFTPTEVASPFVGRQRELDTLLDAARRAAEGQGQVVFVAGEAGMGKSRLIAELRRRLADRPHRWLEGRCAPYGANTSFLPLLDGLRRFLGITDEDDESSASEKIRAEATRLGDEIAWTIPHLRQLLSLNVEEEAVRGLDSASRRSELFRALRALILRDAELQPLVMLIEDLHWIDPASEELFGFLAEAIAANRILLLFSHRTGYSHPFGDRSNYTRITLAPLSEGEMATISGSLLGVDRIPAPLRDLVASKAEGNPFFVEELTRSLLEDGSLRREDDRVVLDRGGDMLAVPHTIQDVLIARIDRLAGDSRRAIQIASVIGREFALRLLARITDAGDRIRTHVEELRTLELIYEKSFSPELAYMFKHALTHDVAYDSVAVERRRQLHRTIGLTIEELYADRLAEHYETLAHHFSRAEDWSRSLKYHRLSAEKAAENFANRAAIDHFCKALSAAERAGTADADETYAALHEQLGRCYYFLSEFAASGAAYESAAKYYRDSTKRALCLASGAFSHVWAHHYDLSWRCLNEAQALLSAHPSLAAQAMTTSVTGFYRGVLEADVGEYERQAHRALDLCRQTSAAPVEALARFNLVQVAEWNGRYQEAISRAEETLALARRERMPDIIIFSTWFLGKALCCVADYGGAIRVLQEAYDLCERIGDRAWRSRMLNTLGWCYGEIGSWELARQHNQRGAELAEQIGDPEIISNARINLALNHLRLGDVERAIEFLDPIERAIAQPGDPWMRWRYSMHVWDVRAEIELARGQAETALALAAREHQAALAKQTAKMESRALLMRSRALLSLGEIEPARAALSEAHAIAERIGYKRAIWEALGGLADVERRVGRSPQQQELEARAQVAVRAAANSLQDRGLVETLLSSVAR